MGKRRKAIRWLVAIVIVALIGGVTAVAVDRRIREQVEEEYLDRVMEMVNLNGWYRKALSITGEAKYSWDGIEYPEGMYIDKKSIYTQILEIRLFTTKYKEMEYSDVDQLLQEYESFCETGQKSEILDANWNYQHDLSIEGTLDLFSFDFDLDGIDWRSMPVDRYLIYARILEIRLFVPEYAIDYTGVDSLLEEYDSFCNTGRNSKILDEFHKDCEMAATQVSEKGIQFDDIVSMMAWLGKGKLKIEDGEIIEDKEAGEGIYLSDFSDEELMELCRTFENNSDVIIDYMMEKGKLKEMEKNEKG